MSKKKVLLVGDASSYFIKSIYANVTSISKYELGIFNINPKNSNQSHTNKSNVNFNSVDGASKSFSVKLANWLANIKIPFLKTLLYKAYLLYNFINYYRVAKKYDVLNFHHLDDNARKYIHFSTRFLTHKKHILSLWGSDFYKRERKEDDAFKQLLIKAHTITFTNEKSKELFISEFDWEKDNIFVIQFGLAQLDLIRNNQSAKDVIKRELSIAENKTVLTVGYNASVNQQHEAIITELKVLAEDKEWVEELHLIVPLTYGAPLAYKEKLSKIYKKLAFSSTIYENYLDDELITKLRKVSDIMIQLQQTDQFSGSMQEYLFANNIVITGSWLPYGIFKEKGVYFEEIHAISEVANRLKSVLLNKKEYDSNTKNNADIIYKISSWESTIHKWTELYEL